MPEEVITEEAKSNSIDLKAEQPLVEEPLAHSIDISLIDVVDRARKDHGNIYELGDSIKAVGFLSSLCVQVMPNGRYQLIGGGRRYRAAMMLGLKTVPCIIKSEAYTERQRTLAELEENLKRKNLEWPEEYALLEKLHHMKIQEFGKGGQGQSEHGWNTKKTAAEVEQNAGEVAKKLQLAAVMRERPDIALRVKHLNATVAQRRAGEILQSERLQKKLDKGEIQTSASILHGSCIDLIKQVPDGSVDLIITDPPFGIDEIENMVGDAKGSSTSYTAFLTQSDNSSLEEVKQLLGLLVPEMARVLKPTAHFYIFHAPQIYQLLCDLLRAQDLHVDHAPIIWDKEKTTGKFQGLSYPPSYEPILFGHKLPRSNHLLDPKCRNIIRCAALHSSKKVHPFQKPQELIEQLIKNSSKIGDNILDPFAGSGVVIRTAKEMNRNATGFELDKGTWGKAQVYLTLGAAAVIG